MKFRIKRTRLVIDHIDVEAQAPMLALNEAIRRGRWSGRQVVNCTIGAHPEEPASTSPSLTIDVIPDDRKGCAP